MERAVVERGLEVDDGVARDGALVGHVPDALLDPREELAWHDAAHDLLGELDATAGVGLDREPHMAELATSAGLLLVAPLHLGGATDRLPVGDARGVHQDGGAELALEALGRDRDLVLALRPEQLLPGLLLALDPDGGVLLDEPRQADGQLVHVRLGGWLDRDRERG